MLRPIVLSKADMVRFWLKIDKCNSNDCWRWQAGCFSNGYGCFKVKRSSYGAHRVAYVITNGDTELNVCHTCNHPWCCNPNHLYAGTQRRNILQCHAEGRAADHCGENNGHVKLTESDVHEIHRLYVDGWAQRKIAKEFDVNQSQISRICNKKRWSHLTV